MRNKLKQIDEWLYHSGKGKKKTLNHAIKYVGKGKEIITSEEVSSEQAALISARIRF